jgi:predicted HAD superfamily Cof-like phosphohydrolase
MATQNLDFTMTDTFYGQGIVDQSVDFPEAEQEVQHTNPTTNFEAVRQFMTVFGQEVKDFPEFPSEKIQQLRIDLITEELGEFKDAIKEKNIVEVADALTDLLYVVYGAGVAFGLDLDACFQEVHASNMSKLGEDGQPIFREDGKVLKGPNYFKPDLFRVLFANDMGDDEVDTTQVVSVTEQEDGSFIVELKDSNGVVTGHPAVYDEATQSLQLS